MRPIISFCFLSAIVFIFSWPLSAAMIHRYSFSEKPGSFAVADSIGSGDGALRDGGSFTGDGKLDLPGGPTAADSGQLGPYVDLPNRLVSGLNSVTFEMWVTWRATTGPDTPVWQRIFDFGSNTGGQENNPGSGTSFFVISPNPDGRPSLILLTKGLSSATDTRIDTLRPMVPNVETHIAVTYDPSLNQARIFIDGQFIMAGPAPYPLSDLDDYNNWLGRSNFTFDSTINAIYNEFRIYDTALSDAEVLQSFQAGPGNPSPPPLTGLRSLSLKISPELYAGDSERVALVAEYADGSKKDLTLRPDAEFSSSATNVARIASDGMVSAVAPGSTVLTGKVGGEQTTLNLQVVVLPAVHRWSFNEGSGQVVNDLVSGANGTVVGAGTFTSDGKLDLPGGPIAVDSGQLGPYVDLPNGLISKLKNVTFEMWITWRLTTGPDSPVWQRIFDFGGNTGGPEGNPGNGTSYFLISPNPDGKPSLILLTKGAASAGDSRIDTQHPVLPNVETHIAITYDTVLKVAGLYIDGTLIATGPAPYLLSALEDYNNWLGRSNFTFDSTFNGLYNEFRIYPGAMSAADVAASFAAGPNDNGPLLYLILDLDNTALKGTEQQANVKARYTRLAQDVTSNPQTVYTSSHTNILTVDSAGKIRALTEGSATVTASYAGKQVSRTVTVYVPVPSRMIHRYTFNDSPVTNQVKDILGNADGIVLGSEGAWEFPSDGTLFLHGTDGYVDLPNGLLSQLTNATFETWVKWNGASPRQRIFDFGSNSGGEGTSGNGESYIYLTPQSESGSGQFAASLASQEGETSILPFNLVFDQETHMVVTYDYFGGTAKLYVDGEERVSAPATFPLFQVQDINNWLGRSNWPDPFYAGAFNEFRIYDGVLTASDISKSFADGPDVNLAPPRIRIAGFEEVRPRVRLVIESEVAGRTHLVQESKSLSQPSWSTVEDAVITTIEPGRLTAEFPAPSEMRFYRITLE